MNLIEKLGGYDKAKVDLKDKKWRKDNLHGSSEFTWHMGQHIQLLEAVMLQYRRENNIFEVGDLVVRKNKKSKPLIWEVVGYSNVFKDSAICDNENELLNHFSFKDIRHATPEEIKAGHRLEAERHG